MKRPSFQFYPSDWLQDASLRMVSIGARGLWMDMICFMHQGSDYGYLKVNHKVILPANLARMVGSTLLDVEGWLLELKDAGVYSLDDDGCIFSRRMIRDEEVREARAAGGVKGGNPALLGVKKDEQKVNLNANLQPTPSSSSSSSSSKVNLYSDLTLQVITHLNEKAGKSYKPVEANSKLIGARLKEGATLEEMKAVIDNRVALWAKDPVMSKYLRPATLFNAEKYAQYSGELSNPVKEGKFDVTEWMKSK